VGEECADIRSLNFRLLGTYRVNCNHVLIEIFMTNYNQYDNTNMN